LSSLQNGHILLNEHLLAIYFNIYISHMISSNLIVR
jgi:hypothetical protein